MYISSKPYTHFDDFMSTAIHVSTHEQNEGRQLDTMRDFGVEHI